MNSLSSDYMSLAILAAIASAALHPWMTALSKKGAHPLTVNFWGVILAGLIFSFVYFRIGFWGKVMENWELIVISGILHATYVMLVLPLIARHEFQVVYPLTRVVPIFVLIGEILILGTSFAALKILGVCLVVSGALIFG
ncbi:MAG: EamA family transporter, partial [Candidatus Peregrinibacteria bacterium]|nr:EamA family transporter [Candidatus Peregrinibacteria bacterium]